ncbi:LLM class F420-dependent oxidoreductase [Nocardioides piscis]|uniref:LLM class F420-dependent oxidoreductase n=1 Tax=Nocardioides piscis TaxID=2714938 RepID=A0A6G7YF97_9ACTN|nr:LLM class F420-dependent oxidoreductase [Nocardioides piscis]QIK75492.1 LLM class F420-dependent oxidoreductase [Nocardioides piscis]
MKLSMPLMYSGNPRDAADQVSALEKAGLDTVWVAEAYGFDAPTLMGYLAARTETVEIGSGILNIYSRTPSTLLQTAAGLDNVSGGRAILGLGASGPQVIEGFHGVPYSKPLARTAEVIDIVRRGLKRERLENDGIIKLPLTKEDGGVTGLGKPLKLLTHPERDSIPIWVAALGVKSVEQTAAIADGWIPILFHPEKAHLVWGEALAAGAARRSDDLGPLQINAGGMVAIGEGPETKALLDLARPIFALYVGGMGAKGKNFYNDVAVSYGYEQEAEQIQELYLSGKKKEAEALIPTEWLEAANLVGPPSYVRERIEAFREAGVTHLNLTPATDDPAATIAQVKEWVS